MIQISVKNNYEQNLEKMSSNDIKIENITDVKNDNEMHDDDNEFVSIPLYNNVNQAIEYYNVLNKEEEKGLLPNFGDDTLQLLPPENGYKSYNNNDKKKNVKPYERRSIGMIIFNSDNKVLLVENRVTYAYKNFILGKYKKIDIVDLLSKMTANEKIIISQSTFSFLWFYLWNKHGDHKMFPKGFYESRCNIFEKHVKYIRMIIGKTRCSGSEWSLPKGKCEPTDVNDLECAKREVKEETGIDDNDYYIINHEKYNWSINYLVNGIKYINKFYLGYCDKEMEKNFQRLAYSDVMEIDNYKFVGVNSLDEYNIHPTIKGLLKEVGRVWIKSSSRVKKEIQNIKDTFNACKCNPLPSQY